MLDFRKSLLAFAAVALLVVLVAPANAQLIEPSFTCNTSANPTNVRAEGLTELVGDVVVTCTGGTPTFAPGNGGPAFIPQANIVLGLNTNITSRLGPNGSSSSVVDALLLIDEPVPQPTTNANPPSGPFPATNVPLNLAGGAPCQSVTGGGGSTPVNCNVYAGTFNPANSNAYVPPYATNVNVFAAHTQDPVHVSWLGVPIDPPGTSRQLVLRMTNVRANAAQLGISSSLISTQIFAFISINGSQNLILNQSQVTVAYIFQGLTASAVNASALQQCNNLNVGPDFDFFAGSGANGNAEFSVTVKEGFAASFKRRIYTAPGATINTSTGVSADGSQNIPGFSYNTESAYTPVSGTGAPTTGTYGVADTATRILVKINNAGAGVRIVAPTAVPLVTSTSSGAIGTPVVLTTPPATGDTTFTGGFLRLIAGSPDVNGSFGVGGVTNGYAPLAGSATFGGFDTTVFGGGNSPFVRGVQNPWNGGVELTGSGGTFLAVYEVVNADPAVQESAVIPFGVAFTSNTASNIPGTGQSTASVSFAPLSTVTTEDATANIPRFTTNLTALNVFNITTCSCNLLFPFVTNQSGFDTGIAIANTSQDPYGTTPQSGTVTLTYYGSTTGGGAAPAAQTSQNVTGGTELIFTLSSGGDHGITATPGFQGYMIAQAQFQFCHAFAFLSYNIGTANGISQGYLAIQLDTPGLNRTGNVGEVQAH